LGGVLPQLASVMSAIDPTAITAGHARNLRRLVALRFIAVAGQIAVVGVAVGVLRVALPVTPLAALIAALLAVNLITALRLTRGRPVSEHELFAQLLVDVAVLTGLLYLSGGSTNPFTLLYLMPITLSAAALPGRYTWMMAGATAACYSLLMFHYVPLPHAHGHAGADFDLHVLGMWLGFVLSAGLIAYFVVRMGETLRARDAALARLREDALRSERILALGTLATGAAHELGTPLSTVAVLARELDGDLPAGERARKLAVMRDQVQRCKEILARLTASAGERPAASGRGLPVADYLAGLAAQWRALRPDVALETRLDAPRPGPAIVVDETLSQALTNLFNNAADASPERVELHARWDADEVAVEVCDRGPGLPAEVARLAGSAFFTTKAPGQGLGLGLFLARATAQRLGGSLTLTNRDGGGACARLLLPLETIQVSEAL